MCIYSTFWLQWEKENLSPYAIQSDHPWYTQRRESENNGDDRFGSRSRYRTAFEIDKDRVTNSQSFRRLEYKTQVFVTHEGDNYRTRLTHSLEVSEIARHIARSLRLNEHLVEAIALGHDLGHAPYGHVAEATINSWLKELDPPLHTSYHFCHNNHSVENVDHLEPGYDWDDRQANSEGFAQGLNLTIAVREGLLTHTSAGYRGEVHKKARFNKEFEEGIRKLSDSNREKGLIQPGSLEAQAVRIADDLAQRIHDLEDGLRSGILNKDDIRIALGNAFEELKFTIFECEDNTANEKGAQQKQLNIRSLSTRTILEHKYYHTKVSKIFIADVVAMLNKYLAESDHTTINEPQYEGTTENRIKSINNFLRKKDEYREKFIRTAIVSFLLHMWRDDEYLKKLSTEELETSKLRVYKYLKFISKILDGNKKDYPAYHIIAFLRGAMLANVIEHSYWEIHRRLDPDFRQFDSGQVKGELIDSSGKRYLIFVVVDGFTWLDKQNKLQFEKVDKTNRLYCFEFKNEQEVNDFLEKNFDQILKSNGLYLKKLTGRYTIIDKICWLNKSKTPGKTRIVSLKGDSLNIQLNLDKVKIFFTGYKDLCPGIQKGTCSYGKQHGRTCAKSSKECHFWSKKIKYPDITRLVGFQDHMHILDFHIKSLISAKIHNGSRVARMNYMGQKVIHFLLDLYLKNHRLMHERVWSRLRIYPEMQNADIVLQEWIDKPLSVKDKAVFPENVLKSLTDPDHPNRRSNHFSLVRRIIEHVAGMTDRYISKEFNRVNQSGREVEKQDETYFFY